MNTEQTDRGWELDEESKAPQQEPENSSQDGAEDELSSLFSSAVAARKVDPVRLSQEKQNISETNIYYIYGNGSPITMARNISDSNIQCGTSHKADEISAATGFSTPPDSQEAMNHFLQKLYPDESFFSFLTIIFLGTVKERTLRQWSGQLQNLWERRFGKSKPEDDLSENRLRSQVDLLKEIFSTIDTYVMSTCAGEVQVQCIHTADQKLEEQGRRWFWELFPDHRKTIVDWLFRIVRGRDGFAARCAREAINKCSAFSFYDFQELILPQFTDSSNSNTAAWLADVLREMLKNPALSTNTVALLRHLTSLSNSALSVTGIYLLDELDDSALEKQAADLLEKALLGRIRGDQLRVSVLFAVMSSARYSQKVYNLLMESLRMAQIKADSSMAHTSLEDAYLHLSMSDYLTAGRSQPELLLLDLRTKLPRDASLPLFMQCWRNPDTARFLVNVWDAYFDEAEKNRYSLEYTQVFWRCMALQRSRIEFNRTLSFLREAERKHPGLATFFRSMRKQLERRLTQAERGVKELV